MRAWSNSGGGFQNIVKSTTARPDMTRAWMSLHTTLMFGQSDLTRPQREMREIKNGAIITTLDDGTGKDIRREEFHCFPSGTDPRPRYKE